MKKSFICFIIFCVCLTISSNAFAWSPSEYKIVSNGVVNFNNEEVMAHFKPDGFSGKVEFTIWNLQGAPEGTSLEVVESIETTKSYIPYSYGWSVVSRRSQGVFLANGNVLHVVLATIKKEDKTAPTAGITTNSTGGNPVVINPIVVGPSIAYAKYTVYIYNVTDSGSGVKNVDFYTWTEANGQDELIKTPGIYDAANNRWYAEVNTLDHKLSERGNYITHIYAMDNSGNYGCVGGIVTTVK